MNYENQEPQFEANQDIRHEANQALDAIVQKLSDEGENLQELEQHINAVKQAIRNTNNEANRDLDVLVQILGTNGVNLNELNTTAIRRAIKETKE